MHNYTNLHIWKDAINLAQVVYELTEQLPQKENFGLISQMTRAVVSVASNIAERAGRSSEKDFVHFLSIAVGSLFELNTQVIIAERVGYIDNTQSEMLQSKIITLQKMVIGYQKKISNSAAV